jgi:ABC-type uncharacterized transport system ATPase subunit
MSANAIIFDKVTKSFGTVRAVDEVSISMGHRVAARQQRYG